VETQKIKRRFKVKNKKVYRRKIRIKTQDSKVAKSKIENAKNDKYI